ncbi:predicted protein [Nematostella vectensis]|uniref:Tetraspanin n=1 Tax=Nematostella vectensis TaxID=45351 RepID=A7S1M9_NEMVE|nr:predicted protein [Nematostella vectensis]|eukprot:XP_001634451.1 predicted protein [Nematostella vectensis]
MAKVQPNRRRRPGQPDDPSLCVKYSLFAINVIFWLAGAVILAVGIFIFIEMKEEITKLADLNFQPAVIFLALGGLLFVITIFGCIGALRENRCLLTAYIWMCGIILAGMIVCGGLGFYYKDVLETKVTAQLKDAIVLYRDPTKGDLHLIIDTVQTELQCCGVQGLNDWDANIYFNCSGPARERCGVPYSCCRKDLQENRQCGYGARSVPTSQAKENGIFTEGCVKTGIAWINTNLYLIGGIGVGILILQLATICLAQTLKAQVNALVKFAKTQTF